MAEPLVLPFSNANWLAAASIWRRLLMQALACEVARAFTKLGIAIAANRPMMATTIMISTSVKPALRRFFIVFIFFLSVYVRCEQHNRRVMMITALFTSLPVVTATDANIAVVMPSVQTKIGWRHSFR